MHPKPFIAVIAVMCVTASAAFAAGRHCRPPLPHAAEPRFEMPARDRWYGAQPLVTDVLAIGATFASIATSHLCFGGGYSESSPDDGTCDNTQSGARDHGHRSLRTGWSGRPCDARSSRQGGTEPRYSCSTLRDRRAAGKRPEQRRRVRFSIRDLHRHGRRRRIPGQRRGPPRAEMEFCASLRPADAQRE